MKKVMLILFVCLICSSLFCKEGFIGLGYGMNYSGGGLSLEYRLFSDYIFVTTSIGDYGINGGLNVYLKKQIESGFIPKFSILYGNNLKLEKTEYDTHIITTKTDCGNEVEEIINNKIKHKEKFEGLTISTSLMYVDYYNVCYEIGMSYNFNINKNKFDSKIYKEKEVNFLIGIKYRF